MADLSKNTQVVSSGVTENVSVCPLISPESSGDISPSELQKESDVDLLGDGSSLQELIDTELAFRVSGKVEQQDENEDSPDEATEMEIASSDRDEIYDVNTQFLMAERKSCFENLSTNATHFFTLIDEEADPEPLPDSEDDSPINEVSDAFENLDMNGRNIDFGQFKTPVDMTDSQQDSSSSPLSPLDADILKYSSTFGETIVDSASEEVGETDIGEPDDDDEDGLMGGPLIDKREAEDDPAARGERRSSPEGACGLDPDVVPFQDFFTPIPEDVDDALDLEFQQNLGMANGANGFDVHHLLNNGYEGNEDSLSGAAACKGDLPSPDAETDPTIEFPEEVAANGASGENGQDDFDLSANLSNADVSIEGAVGREDKYDANLETDAENSSEEPLHDELKEVDVCSTNTDPLSSASSSDLENNEMVSSSSSEKKIVKKKKKSEGGETAQTKKTKKTKKEEKENISVKSSFSKFDQLSKKTVLHVRSVDTSKVQKQFSQSATSGIEVTSNCRACGKQVFQMEQIKAERAVWHKNCFRCKECNKQLNVDNYSSNEGVLYCQPHFKDLFKPKAVLEDDSEPKIFRRPKMIICENQPVELPPEVVRASDKPDLGLEELTALNVKSRYQVFEKTESNDDSLERSPSSVSVKRSPSILSKLARFQAKGMDIGITDESINNIPYEESSSSSEEEPEKEDEEEADKAVIRANRKQRERPMSFNKMGDMKCRWETGQTSKDERREERKQEIQNIRSRLFMGKQGKMKEMYEQAVQDSERISQKKDIDIRSEKAKSIKEKFERGEILPDDDDDDENAKSKHQRKSTEEDPSIFEEGISKKSRSLFLELDSKANQAAPNMSPLKSPTPRDEVKKIKEISPQVSKDIVRASDAVEDVKVETKEVFNKFKFFETYKEPEREKKQFRITPPRDGQVKDTSPETEIYRDPSIVRSEDKVEDEIVRTKTTSKMLSLFRQMEENASKEEMPEGPKPLKRFTPPPDYTHESENSEEEEETEDEEEEEEEEEEDERDGNNPNIVRASDKVEDEFLKQAATAARAKVLRAKFERWEEKENKLNNSSSGCNLDFEQSEQPSIDSTKSLRAKFESLKSEAEQPRERNRPKVNRFVEMQAASIPLCSTCEEKVYPLEKIEMSGKIFHKQCFRCLQCNCVLRMETYTFNNDKLYCIPHFKQLFIAKGNYEEGFGFDQHKRKWYSSNHSNDIFNE